MRKSTAGNWRPFQQAASVNVLVMRIIARGSRIPGEGGGVGRGSDWRGMGRGGGIGGQGVLRGRGRGHR